MKKYIEIGYPIYPEMPVYPGLPEVKLDLREDLEKGAPWNGSVISIYLHAGTHVDAPWHYLGGDAPKMHDTEAIPTEQFVYDSPVKIDINPKGQNYLITVEDLQSAGEKLYQADMLIFDTGWWKKRAENFMEYATGFPALSWEAAKWIRENLPKIKAVAIDTLSIENIGKDYGAANGYLTHKTLLDPELPNHSVLVYEDVNMEGLQGVELIRAFSAPLRIKADASNCNIICEIDDLA